MPELPANPALSALQDRLNAELRETRYRVTLAEDGPLPFELRAYVNRCCDEHANTPYAYFAERG